MPSDLIYFPKLSRRNNYPAHNRYRKYRNEIREDSQYRCVYCDIPELELGFDQETRDQRMTLDHFRPQSLFSSLENDPRNLVLSCQTCNGKKRDDWPAFGRSGTVDGNVGYIDAFADNRLDYFEVLADGNLNPLKPPAQYMIRVLMLNRPAAKRIRKRRRQLYESMLAFEIFFDQEIQAIVQLLQNTIDSRKTNVLNRKLAKLKTMRLTLDAIDAMIKLY